MPPGRQAAQAFLTNAAATVLHDGAVTVTVTGDTVTVTVTGTSQNLAPGLTFQVTEQAAGPIEPTPQ